MRESKAQPDSIDVIRTARILVAVCSSLFALHNVHRHTHTLADEFGFGEKKRENRSLGTGLTTFIVECNARERDERAERV